MKFLRALWFFVSPFLSLFARDISVVLAEAAMRAVTVAASEYRGQGGEAKREMAFAEIKKDLKAKGLEAKDNMINAAIEAAVAKLKKQAR